MRYDTTPTTAERHRRNNDRQLLVFKRQRPDLYERLLDGLTPESRSHLEARVATMEREEAEEGGQ